MITIQLSPKAAKYLHSIVDCDMCHLVAENESDPKDTNETEIKLLVEMFDALEKQHEHFKDA